MAAGNLYLQANTGNIITVNAQDGDSGVAVIPSGGGLLVTNVISKVASNVVLSGNLALENSVVTKSNANVTYTGNGTTQDIVTGIASVDFTVASNGSGFYHDRAAGDCIVKNDAGTIIESGTAIVNTSKVHIKSRSIATQNIIHDGLRGFGKYISTDLTGVEAFQAGLLTSFNSNGITVSNNVTVNQNLATYILHQTLYTHIKWGLTSQGKRYITAYNPVTREVMTMYQGSGVAGHQIPNPLGIKLDYIEIKCLTSATAWQGTIPNIGRIFTNLANAASNDTYVTTLNEDNISFDNLAGTLGDVNANNASFIAYGFANSETKKIIIHQGNGAANVMKIGWKPSRTIEKPINSVGSWYVFDYARESFSKEFQLNSSTVESIAPSIRTATSEGISINSDWASGIQVLVIAERDTTASNDDTYFDLPTDNTNLSITNGKLAFTNGRSSNGGYKVETQDFTGSVDFSTCPDGIHYVALDSNNAPKFYEKVAIGSYDKTSADDNRLVFDTESGKWFTTTGFELVTNGNFDSNTLAPEFSIMSAGSVLTIENNQLKVTTTNNLDHGFTYTMNSLVVGEKYVIEMYVNASSPNAGMYFDPINATLFKNTFLFTTANSKSVSLEFTANSTMESFTLRNVGNITSPWYMDNISIYKKEATLGTELPNPICFIDDKPYQVTSETPMNRLVDYPSIPKNVMESTYVDGNLEVSGSVKGRNQCTAWVVVNGDTTPPTIIDSYNVKDVVRVSTGVFDIYYEEAMKNINASIVGIAQANTFVGVPAREGSSTLNKIQIHVRYPEGASNYNSTNINIQIFGGK